jgi:uncharacterized protein YjbI with pentapeptide repeats
MPMEQLQIVPFREAVFQSRNAEEALLAALNACARVTGQVSNIEHPAPTAFGAWFKRVQGQRAGGDSVLAAECLSYLNLRGAVLHISDFFQARFHSSDLQYVSAEFACFGIAELREANLRGANLEGANLRVADLERANLEGAILREANLEGANLKGANLKAANLKTANLEGANLKGANLEGANLKGANLARVNLEEAILEGANLEEAILGGDRPKVRVPPETEKGGKQAV